MSSPADWRNNWIAEIEQELQENILSFWMTHTRDEEHGGFLGEIAQTMQVNRQADKSLVLNTRILWTFASAYRIYKDERFLATAERAYQYLTGHFIDREHGGLFWMVSPQGNPTEDKKQVYGQAFMIYALSEYYRAAGRHEALNLAIELFRLLEKHSYDPVNKGYVEALARDWSQTDNLSLSGKDLNEKKSMNTHLHVLEGYTNLFRVWPSEELRSSLRELVEVTLKHIIDRNTAHFKLFFDEQWVSKSDHISYGHDIEGSWLLVEAAEVLGDEELLLEVKRMAVRMAEAALNEGVDPDGGMLNEADSTGYVDTDKDWWPQAEAVIGFYNAYQMTGDLKYLEASQASWQFIRQYIVDKDNGEWFWSVTRDGVPTEGHAKVSAWKCPYHNGRACFEMIQRLGNYTGNE
ncbi:N-acyl-D-glucosamine 2-epimerase [Paenibacillus sambharensis]|uniref:Cellobiose 2-epimerase n=1 Tax=Paenibacillus sambharensis TaxID=1803190 RepID=A0A2W1L919_9BACL|nr:AGE family epimerase/isomerase [Paenibacillus sambharensis]PZD94630.1 N-acyl-D-glucosamine 2-epimerase [Paenibacillus sambharensis]